MIKTRFLPARLDLLCSSLVILFVVRPTCPATHGKLVVRNWPDALGYEHALVNFDGLVVLGLPMDT